MSKRIFISHASADAKLVDAFVDLLKIVNIRDDDIFCSSLEGLSIPSGENFVDFIKSQIKEPDAVIVFLSKNYYTRPFCLSELGAAWVLSHRLFPILVPPLSEKEIKDVLTGVWVTNICKPDALSTMVQDLVNHLDLGTINIARWGSKLKIFETNLVEMLRTLPVPDNPTKEELEKLRKFEKDSMSSFTDYEDRIARLEEKIEALKVLKDRQEVLGVENNFLDDSDQFENEVLELKSVLSRNQDIVNYAIFKSLYGEGLSARNATDYDYFVSEAKNAVEMKFLIEEDIFGNIKYELNEEERSIRKSLKQIEVLQNCISELSPEAFEALSDKYDFDPDITNKRLWKEVLGFSFYGL